MLEEKSQEPAKYLQKIQKKGEKISDVFVVIWTAVIMFFSQPNFSSCFASDSIEKYFYITKKLFFV